MRILIYGLNFAPELTGIGKYTGEMAQWLAAKGHDVRVVTAPPYYPQWRVQDGYTGCFYKKERLLFENNFIDLWRCPLWVPYEPGGMRRLLHLGSFSASSGPIVLAQARWRPDLIFSVEPTLFAAPWVLIAGKLAGAKTWLHIQDFELDAAFDLGLLRFSGLQKAGFAAERILLNAFDRVSTISEKMLEKLGQKGVAREKRVFFPNWVDIDLIYPLGRQSRLRDELEITDDAIVVLYAGNMGQKQGLELLIDAAVRLQENARIWFVMCGQGSARNRIRKMAEGLSNVLWLPLQPENRLNELLNLADIHLLPQRADAADLVMPSKLTGMLASGKAIVACAEPETQVGKVVGKSGVIVPPGDGRALASAINALAGDPERREDLGRKARDYAERFLDYDVIMSGVHDEMMRI